jgi:NAD(P)-dependent dehydrogenase (short-subunit alcohol dehydrogenase family)
LLHETGRETWRQVIGINVDGVAYAMVAEIDEMLKAGGGSIVNIASVEAHTIVKEFPAYVASKHALIGLTRPPRPTMRSMGFASTAFRPA